MNLTVQFETLMSMIVMGIFFGMLLDTYQRFLHRSKRAKWITFICDLFIWFIYAGLLFYILYQVNEGEVRFYIFLAVLCGFSAYQALFKSIYLKLLNAVIRIFIQLYLFIKRIISILIIWPIVMVFKGVLKLISFIGTILMALVKMCLQLLLWIGKIVFSPLILVWRLFPIGVRKRVSNIFQKIEGYIRSIKKQLITITKRWKK